MASRRSLFVVVGLAASAGLALIPVAPLALRDRLPDPIASHWGTGGRPDGHMSLTASLVADGVLWLVMCAMALLVGWKGWGRRVVRAWTGATLGFGAGLTAGVIGAMLRANLDRASWREAGDIGWEIVALVLLGAVGAGAVGWLVGDIGPDRVLAPPAGEPPRLTLGEGERPIWIGYVHSRWAVWLGAALAGTGVIAATLAALLPEPLTPGRPVAVALLVPAVTGLAGLTLSSARVTVDARGLAVAFGPLGRPVKRIALDRASSAWVEERSPIRVGGWGYRVGAEGTTVMLRGGECLVVEYDQDRRFAVSVDDAERGAALLNALRARSGV